MTLSPYFFFCLFPDFVASILPLNFPWLCRLFLPRYFYYLCRAIFFLCFFLDYVASFPPLSFPLLCRLISSFVFSLTCRHILHWSCVWLLSPHFFLRLFLEFVAYIFSSVFSLTLSPHFLPFFLNFVASFNPLYFSWLCRLISSFVFSLTLSPQFFHCTFLEFVASFSLGLFVDLVFSFLPMYFHWLCRLIFFLFFSLTLSFHFFLDISPLSLSPHFFYNISLDFVASFLPLIFLTQSLHSFSFFPWLSRLIFFLMLIPRLCRLISSYLFLVVFASFLLLSFPWLCRLVSSTISSLALSHHFFHCLFLELVHAYFHE